MGILDTYTHIRKYTFYHVTVAIATVTCWITINGVLEIYKMNMRTQRIVGFAQLGIWHYRMLMLQRQRSEPFEISGWIPYWRAERDRVYCRIWVHSPGESIYIYNQTNGGLNEASSLSRCAMGELSGAGKSKKESSLFQL